jgi:hypothetical protein
MCYKSLHAFLAVCVSGACCCVFAVRMTNREPLPGLNIGDDPGRILSWTSIGYDPVAQEYPAAHYFPDCVSAMDRIRAHEAPFSCMLVVSFALHCDGVVSFTLRQVHEQLGMLAGLRVVKDGAIAAQNMVTQLRAITKLWADGHLVWGPLLAFAYVKGHPISMHVPADSMHEVCWSNSFGFYEALSLRQHHIRVFLNRHFPCRAATALTTSTSMFRLAYEL